MFWQRNLHVFWQREWLGQGTLISEQGWLVERVIVGSDEIRLDCSALDIEESTQIHCKLRGVKGGA